MELEIIEEKKNRIVLKIKGETHTFCNALKKALLDDKHVKIATYKIDHPLIGIPEMIVETDGKDPKKALKEASDRLSKIFNKFKSVFLKGVK